MRRRRRLASDLAGVMAAGLFLAVVVAAQPRGLDHRGKDVVAVHTLADVSRVGPGQTFHVVVVFDLEPKWHIYWKNPGEGALAPRVIVEAPPGFAVGATRWPRPRALKTALGPEYCYFDEVALFVPVTAPGWLDSDRVTLTVKVDWAVCRDVCRLGSARHDLVVETVARASDSKANPDPVLARYRKRMPRAVSDVKGGSVSFDGRELTVTGPAHGAEAATFFPGSCPGVTYGAAGVHVADDRFVVSARVDVKAANTQGPMVIDGLVAVGDRPDGPCYDFELTIETP
jgi:thiol:disulfide interchange protein DsbD